MTDDSLRKWMEGPKTKYDATIEDIPGGQRITFVPRDEPEPEVAADTEDVPARRWLVNMDHWLGGGTHAVEVD